MRAVIALPQFRRLAVAYGLNEVATQIAAVALVTLVYRRSGSALGAAAVFLATMIVPALVAPVVVARIARRPGRVRLPGLYGVEVVLYGLLALAAADGVPVGWLLALALVDGIIALAARSLARVATATVAGEHGLAAQAAALNNIIFSVCYMAGPGIGGALILLGGVTLALAGVAGVFGATALILIPLRGAALLPEAAAGATGAGGLRGTIRHVIAAPGLRRIFGVRAAGLVLLTISIPVEVVLAQRVLRAGPSGYPLLLSAWGVGTVIGSLVYGWRATGRSALLWGLGAALMAAGFGVMGLAGTLAVAAAGSVLAGAGNGIDAGASRMLLMETVADEHATLVVALNEALWQGLPAAGILLGGVLAQTAGARTALLTAAVGAAGLACLTLIALRDSGRMFDDETLGKSSQVT